MKRRRTTTTAARLGRTQPLWVTDRNLALKETPMSTALASERSSGRHVGNTAKVIAYLEARPNRTADVRDIATATGCSPSQVNSALHNLKTAPIPRVRRVGSRTYALIHAQPLQRPGKTASPNVMQLVPARPNAEPTETIDIILDLLFPKGFRARDLAAIREWTACTENLIAKVSAP